MVALTWLFVPLIGTVPYLVAGQGTIAYPVDALFESMSGFTTTGSTVLEEISFEQHSRSILMWRQLTQWLGGMGIVVLMVAILPELSVGGTQLMREEAPGPSIEKLAPHIRQTARELWKIYIGLTVAALAVYYGLHLVGFADNMDFYNAVAHALTTLPTGGFSPEGRSVEAFSPAIQWAMIPFMIVAGTNFALLWYVWQGRSDRLTENAEFRSYLLALACVGTLLSILLFLGVGLDSVPDLAEPIPGDLEHSIRQAAFQTAAIVTTTGYASMDFNTWSPAAQTILLFAMFLGGIGSRVDQDPSLVRHHENRPPRTVHGGPSGSRSTGQDGRRSGRRGDDQGVVRLHVRLPRHVRVRDRGAVPRRGPDRPRHVGARGGERFHGDAREHRSGVRNRRPDEQLLPVLGLGEVVHGVPDVDRAPRDPLRVRDPDAGVLAVLIATRG